MSLALILKKKKKKSIASHLIKDENYSKNNNNNNKIRMKMNWKIKLESFTQKNITIRRQGKYKGNKAAL